MAGSEVALLTLDEQGAQLSPTLPLGGLCSEILPTPDGGALLSHSAGLTRLLPAALPTEAPRLDPLLTRRNLDGFERDRDGTLYLLEHPREEHGEPAGPHAILRLSVGGALDTIATASPSAYDLTFDPSARRLFVTHVSGRSVESWVEYQERWVAEETRRVELGAADAKERAAEPKDDAFWLARLLFLPPHGEPWLLLQGREVKPRLAALLDAGGVRQVAAWPTAFLARNGVMNPSGDLLYLNAGRAIFLLQGGEAIAEPRRIELAATALASDGDHLAVLSPLTAERSAVELWDRTMKRRLASTSTPGGATALAFLRAKP
ncbi:MAG: hypothetical protein U0527_02565 [Candidatus Eisenbacteria bacterium]